MTVLAILRVLSVLAITYAADFALHALHWRHAYACGHCRVMLMQTAYVWHVREFSWTAAH